MDSIASHLRGGALTWVNSHIADAERRGQPAFRNWHIYLIFHVSRLKKFHRSAEFVREVSPPPPDLVEGHLEYEVESIARHRGEGARRRYLVIWKGYPLHEASWEPEQNLANAAGVLAEYLQRIRSHPSR